MIEIPTGWQKNNFGEIYQKVNGRVYVYVSRMLFGWMVQLYERGNVSYCALEARTSDPDPAKMFALGEEWLQKYGQAELTEALRDYYSISNPDGAWGRDFFDKKYWI